MFYSGYSLPFLVLTGEGPFFCRPLVGTPRSFSLSPTLPQIWVRLFLSTVKGGPPKKINMKYSPS